jgi:hypothetical protein
MRHLIIGFVLASAAMAATAPAKADFGGPLINDKGECRQFGTNSNNLIFYYYGKCPTTITRHGHTHAVRTAIRHTHS